jgi:hypothetical protein
MIDRKDYHMMMTVLAESCTIAEGPVEFMVQLQQLIMASYEINVPEHGRVNVINFTPYVMEAMGARYWTHFDDLGVARIEMVQFYLHEELILEAGRMLGSMGEDTSISAVADMPEAALKRFAKGMTIGMREHDMHLLKRITGEEGEDMSRLGDDLDLASLIRRYLEEEVDEAVSKFSSQLDAVFGVSSITEPWSAPRGEVKNDDLPPPG